MDKKEIIIYCLKNKINEKKYVGQTIQSLKRRFKGHIDDSKRRKRPISKAILEHGKENFIIFELEKCSENVRHSREAYWIKTLNTLKDGYNVMYRSRHDLFEIEQIVKEFLNGATQSSLSKKHNIDRGEILAYLKERNINGRRNQHSGNKKFIKFKYDEAKTPIIIKMYKDGATIGKIIKTVKSHRITISNILYKAGFNVKPKQYKEKVPYGHNLDPRIADKRKILILKLYDEGNSIREIQIKTGIYRQYISKTLKENNKEIRPYKFYSAKTAT